ETLIALCSAVDQLIAPLKEGTTPLPEWAEPLRAVAATVYGSETLSRDDPAERYTLQALFELRDALDRLATLPAKLQPVVDARQASRILLAGLAGPGIPPPADPTAIELMGWLDLPLDDAPATIVTTFNEGLVPSATTADAFLPNGLRQALGLLDND